MGIIILLLGIGSAGKSSVAQCLKKRYGDRFKVVGFDYAVEEKLEQRYWPGNADELEGFYYLEEENGPKLCAGSVGKKFLDAVMADIIASAKSGNNLIIDSVLSEQEYAKIETELTDCKIVRIGLKPPLSVIIQRESERGDRKTGIASRASL